MPYYLNIIWWRNNKKTVIGQGYSFDVTEDLNELLSKALDNKLFFNEKIYINIGLIWSYIGIPDEALSILLEFGNQQNLKVELPDEKYGPTYLFHAHHSTKKYKKTFIYNNELGEIVLLIAPQFTWKTNPDSIDDSDYFDISEPEITRYKDYLHNYKPFFKKIIPQEVAQQWVIQAKYFNDLFKENEFGNCIHCNDNTPVDFEKHPNGVYHEREVK
jgi:hypothetical protein